MSDQPQSIIIPSGNVNPTWLMLTLGTPWFGGGYEPDLQLLPRDRRPVRLDGLGNDCTGGLS